MSTWMVEVASTLADFLIFQLPVHPSYSWVS